MITNYAQMSVKLVSLMENEEARNALNNSLANYPLYAGKKNYDLIPTREQLNEKILNHYKYHEIGFETVGRFLDELKITMNEIMPYYNELFKTIEIMADLENPFDNVDVTETFEETRNDSASTSGESASTSRNEASDSRTSETTATSDGTTTNKNKFSDTPQNNVNNINNYLTEYREENNVANTNSTDNTTSNGSGVSEATGTATTTSESESTGTTRHTFTKKGNQGVNTYAHDMNEFRTSIIDVMDRIIHDNRIAELFMLVW